jgi:hypothetical protein
MRPSQGHCSNSARVLAVLTSVTAWAMSAPTASADSIDVVYFNGLTAHGITAAGLGVPFDLASAVELGHVDLHRRPHGFDANSRRNEDR